MLTNIHLLKISMLNYYSQNKQRLHNVTLMDLNLNTLTYSINKIHCITRLTGSPHYYKEIINISNVLFLCMEFEISYSFMNKVLRCLSCMISRMDSEQIVELLTAMSMWRYGRRSGLVIDWCTACRG